MDLPAEIRLNIYEQLYEYINIRQQTSLARGKAPDTLLTTCTSRYALAILDVNKQVRDEAYHIAMNCPITVEALHGPGVSRRRIAIDLPLQVTRRIRIIATDRTAWDLWEHMRSIFAQYPSLQRLELRDVQVALYVSVQDMKPLLRAGVREFTAPELSVSRFQNLFPKKAKKTVEGHNVVVVMPCYLLNHKEFFYLNGDRTHYNCVSPSCLISPSPPDRNYRMSNGAVAASPWSTYQPRLRELQR